MPHALHGVHRQVESTSPDPSSPALDRSHETIMALFDSLRVARAAHVVTPAPPPQSSRELGDCCLGLDSVEGTSSLTLDRHRMHSRPACITRRPTDWLASVPRDHWKNMGRPRRNFQLRCGGPRLRHDDGKLRASERAR
jgi:hypothetical protein